MTHPATYVTQQPQPQAYYAPGPYPAGYYPPPQQGYYPPPQPQVIYRDERPRGGVDTNTCWLLSILALCCGCLMGDMFDTNCCCCLIPCALPSFGGRRY
uniref:CYSTM domain-containing protein n=1 Tax=Steinernema glaseri TaxID=37863 RepID=A0A1I7YBX0_9BILA